MSKTNTQKEGQSNPAEGKNISSHYCMAKAKTEPTTKLKTKTKIMTQKSRITQLITVEAGLCPKQTQKEGQSNAAEGKNISSSLLLGKVKAKTKTKTKTKIKIKTKLNI